MLADGETDLRQRVVSALSLVNDPELDEPITELGFVRRVSITDEGRVSVDLVTSTFWCSPNFVYMMLEDARAVLSKVPGVREVRVELAGHHDSARINEAINDGKSFSECYGSETRSDLVELNRIFREKALRSRLHAMSTALARSGLSGEDLLRLRMDDIELAGGVFTVKSHDRLFNVADSEDVGRITRYLNFLKGLGRTEGPLVIWDLAGNPPARDEFNSFLGTSRSTRAAFSLNAELCRALLESRLNREEPQDPDRGPRGEGS